MKIKNSYIIAMAVTLLLTPSVKAAGQFQFLDYQEFQNLTSGEKKIYIDAVQKVSIAFEDSLSSLSSRNAKWSALFSSPAAQAEMKADNTYESSDNDTRMENAKLSYLIGRIPLYDSTQASQKGDGIKQHIKDVYANAYVRMLKLSKKKMSSTENKYFAQNLKSLRKAQDIVMKYEPGMANERKAIDALSQQFQVQDKSGKKSAPKYTEIITEKAADQVATPHCIYAGFLITKSKCEAPIALPAGFELKEISTKDFKCDVGQGNVICNPLVFGYKNSKTAYCTSKSISPSKECSRASDNLDNAKRLLAMWNNPENKNAIQIYQNELKSLCDPSKQRSSDVLKTCKVVQAQFNGRLQAEVVVASKQRLKESSTTKESILPSKVGGAR